jgi:glutamyl-tRNA synthetase
VDDHLMETSHVIRGEEWLPSLPLHHLLYKAFGWNAPEFAHLPLILKPIGNGKLSKRDGDKMGFPVFPLNWKNEDGTISSGYRESGYFPEAVVNFLALLGWNDGTDQELFSLEDLVEKFDLNRVHKAGAKFDPEKNKWFNHQYLQKQSDESLAENFKQILSEKNISTALDVTKITSLIKERANFVSDFWELSDYFFEAPTTYDEKAIKNWKEETPNLMKTLIYELEKISAFNASILEEKIKPWLLENKVMPVLRLCLVGALKGIDLFQLMEILGKEETIKRIEKAVESL